MYRLGGNIVGTSTLPLLIQDCLTAAAIVSQEHRHGQPSTPSSPPPLALDGLLRHRAWQQWCCGSPIAESVFEILVRPRLVLTEVISNCLNLKTYSAPTLPDEVSPICFDIGGVGELRIIPGKSSLGGRPASRSRSFAAYNVS